MAGRRLGVDPRRDQAPPRAGEDARRERVPQPLRHPLAVALPRRPPVRVPRRAARSTGCRYLPAESDTGMFGGNSNWRGPIWMPVNALIIRALLQYYTLLRRRLHVECPTGSGRQMTLYQVAEEIARRLASIFLRGQGRPPAGLRRRRRSSRTTRTGATTSCSTSTSTATTAPASAPATRPAGPASSPASCTCSRRRLPEQVLELGKAGRVEESNKADVPGAPRPRWSPADNSREGRP